jgi:CO/xanthine dehydrogenase Mo-binding subunit
VASAFKNVGSGKGKPEDAGAVFSLESDGMVLARVSGVDVGQGFRTAILQIAVETTGLHPEVFKLVTGDTFLTPRHSSSTGERQTLISGKAAELAAREFKVKLLSKVAALGDYPREELDLRGDHVVNRITGQPVISLQRVAQDLLPDQPVEGECRYLFPPTYPISDQEARKKIPAKEYRNFPSYAYATHVAIVEVDTVSGRTRVLKIIAAHDVGVAINPQKIEGQIEGSCVMGLGYALSEEFVVEKGIFKTRNLKDCGIPVISEAPPVEVIIVEDPEPFGPYGAKGISEVATVPTTPAILNAIYDAIGRRIYILPAKPQQVLALLGKVNSSSRENPAKSTYPMSQ